MCYTVVSSYAVVALPLFLSPALILISLLPSAAFVHSFGPTPARVAFFSASASASCSSLKPLFSSFSSTGNYLSFISSGGGSRSAAELSPTTTPTTTTSEPSSRTEKTDAASIRFHHAPLSYFSIDKLTPNGPRKNPDVGRPHDSTRPLVLDVPVGSTTTGASASFPSSSISAGSWWCSEGGWPSPNPRSTTETFHVLDGHGCLTDADGVEHRFGPGDTIVLPKGWSGRWDVYEAVHKIWFVHDHPDVAADRDDDPVVRAVVAHYRDGTAPHLQSDLVVRRDAVLGTAPCTSYSMVYDVGPTEVGFWTCTPGSFLGTNPRTNTECFHVLEGTFFLTNDVDKTAVRCCAGDTLVLPVGWSGRWDVLETVKKVWVIAD